MTVKVGWDYTHQEFTITDYYYFSILSRVCKENNIAVEEVTDWNELKNYDAQWVYNSLNQMKSLSEIDTTSKRASKAAGYSWGISEEVGKNIRLLEMFGLPGVKNLNDFYKKKKSNNLKI